MYDILALCCVIQTSLIDYIRTSQTHQERHKAGADSSAIINNHGHIALDINIEEQSVNEVIVTGSHVLDSQYVCSAHASTSNWHQMCCLAWVHNIRYLRVTGVCYRERRKHAADSSTIINSHRHIALDINIGEKSVDYQVALPLRLILHWYSNSIVSTQFSSSAALIVNECCLIRGK